MSKQTKSEKTGEKNTHNSNSGKNSTEALTKRHLKDKNDKITDEDIRNIKIDTNVNSEDPLELEEDRPHDVDKDNKTSTPWDVISE